MKVLLHVVQTGALSIAIVLLLKIVSILRNAWLKKAIRMREKYNKKQNNQNQDKRMDNKKEKEEIEKTKKKMKKNKVGSFSGLLDLCKELYKNKPKREEFKEITKKDILAFVLTIIVVILIGIALWFIPFTNGWMRELLFENPLFNWIGSLFS